MSSCGRNLFPCLKREQPTGWRSITEFFTTPFHASDFCQRSSCQPPRRRGHDPNFHMRETETYRCWTTYSRSQLRLRLIKRPQTMNLTYANLSLSIPTSKFGLPIRRPDAFCNRKLFDLEKNWKASSSCRTLQAGESLFQKFCGKPKESQFQSQPKYGFPL